VLGGPVYDLGRSVGFSQRDNIYGTSRATAMGGAFTSLGADLSSMGINPAGLGMYQSSDWSITAALNMDGMQTVSPNMHKEALVGGGNKTTFGLNNLGVAYNVFNSSGTLTSLTLGFGYNRSANFNSRTSFDTFGEGSTIGEAFSHQINSMTAAGVPKSSLYWDENPWMNPDIYIDEWPAVLGFQTWVVDDENQLGDFGYFTDAIPSDTHFTSVSRGGVHEYNFSIGTNLSNILYLGATVGLNEISYQEDTTYEEYYSASVPLETLWFDQRTTLMGSGLNAKLGAVIRPVEALRIGVAFHLPTYYNITRTYQGWMGTALGESNTGEPLADAIRFKTAPRLLAGISGVIGGRAVVALDWDVDWNGNIRTRGLSENDTQIAKHTSQKMFAPAHTFRAGLEIMASDVVSLRLGGSWMPDFFKDDFMLNDPIIRTSSSITAGLGLNIGRNGYLDMAYVYTCARMSDYDLWFYDDGTSLASQWDGTLGSETNRFYTPIRTRHMVTLTLGSRF
jgi:hypothetical protein